MATALSTQPTRAEFLAWARRRLIAAALDHRPDDEGLIDIFDSLQFALSAIELKAVELGLDGAHVEAVRPPSWPEYYDEDDERSEEILVLPDDLQAALYESFNEILDQTPISAHTRIRFRAELRAA